MMTRKITEAMDPDMRASGAAMLRAAELARQTAIRTGTKLIGVKGGKLVRIRPQGLRVTASRSARKSA